MAKQIFVAHFNQLEKAFDRVIDGIDEFVKRDENVTKKTSALLSRDLIKTINTNYTNYMNKISSYEHGIGDVKTSVTDTKKGCVVHITGKDILYEEYGTGTRGLEHPHPKHDVDGMNPYGSGRNIVHGGERNNGHDIPYWYKFVKNYPNDFNGIIGDNDYVWRHNKVVTKGLPAGRFVYDSCRQYQLGSESEKTNVLKKTITQLISEDIANNINKSIKK